MPIFRYTTDCEKMLVWLRRVVRLEVSLVEASEETLYHWQDQLFAASETVKRVRREAEDNYNSGCRPHLLPCVNFDQPSEFPDCLLYSESEDNVGNYRICEKCTERLAAAAGSENGAGEVSSAGDRSAA